MTGQVEGDVYDPDRWSVGELATADVAERLRRVWSRYHACFKTQTRDASDIAWTYVRGLLTMPDQRTFANIARRVEDPAADGQRVQHFMSESPWSAETVLRQVQAEVAATPVFQRSAVLILDESADAKAGPKSAGAGRQYNGRMGKVEQSQMGTFLALATETIWTWIDGELFVPERWFTSQMGRERERVGLPAQRRFATKIELGWQMIQRIRARGVPFEAVLCDELYGRSTWLRRQLDEAGLIYLADVPADTAVYLTRPQLGRPIVSGRRRRRPPLEVVNGVLPVPARHLVQQAETSWRDARVRETERGTLEETFAARRIWTLREGQIAEEWLVIRQHGREASRRYSYALSNAPADTPFERLTWLKCQRFAIECATREAKSDLGWDELQAQKYLAWEHHLALTILASWFVAQTKLEWQQQTPPDPALLHDLGLARLPVLSVANVRELLKATLPLPQLTPAQAQRLVVNHLVGRSRATASRLRHQRRIKDTT